MPEKHQKPRLQNALGAVLHRCIHKLSNGRAGLLSRHSHFNGAFARLRKRARDVSISGECRKERWQMYESCMMARMCFQGSSSVLWILPQHLSGDQGAQRFCSLSSGTFPCSSSFAAASATPGAGRGRVGGVISVVALHLIFDLLFLSSSTASTCTVARGRAHRSSCSRY